MIKRDYLKNMRIGIDARVLMDKRYSGVSIFARELIAEILKADPENEYRLFLNAAADMSGRLPEFFAPNVKIIKTRWPNKIFNYCLQKFLSRPKIDSLLGVDLFYLPHINFIALSKNCRQVITVHDLSFLRYPRFFSCRQNLWHKMINVKKLLAGFEIVAAVSENTKKDIIELVGVSPDRIKVIYPGVSDKFVRVGDEEALNKVKQKYGLPDKFILFLGTVEPRKNVAGLVNAFQAARAAEERMKDYRLVIAGAGGWQNSRIKKLILSLSLAEAVKIIGYVDEEDKPALYSLADLFVYPSFYEGFGFPPLEALACGCPVVASNSSSLPETVKNFGITVNPYDSGEISRAIRACLSDPFFKDRALKNAPEILKLFSWPVAAGRYLDIFKNI